MLNHRDTGSEVFADYVFTKECPFFEGHFPDNPLLPAIVQVMVVCHALSQQGNYQLHKVRRAKFMRPVRPQSPLSLQATYSVASTGLCQVKSELSTPEGACAHIVLELQAGQR